MVVVGECDDDELCLTWLVGVIKGLLGIVMRMVLFVALLDIFVSPTVSNMSTIGSGWCLFLGTLWPT